MARWGRNFFHKFRDKIKKQKDVLNLYVNRDDEEGVERYFEEKECLQDIMKHEETYWKQRSKAFWLIITQNFSMLKPLQGKFLIKLII